MSLASNRYFKQDSGFEKEVSYFDIESWAKLAEACYNKGHKGRGVRVVGRLKQDRWSGSDGKPHSRITIVAEHVEFRPEFKKDDGKVPAADGPIDSDTPYDDEDYPDEEGNEIIAIEKEEVEAAVF
jgi:single-strand DNA-binding protein